MPLSRAPAPPIPVGDLQRPIRVVVFGGAYFEPGALEFLTRLADHPDIDLAGVVCQSSGFGILHRLRDIVRRRGIIAGPVIAIQLGHALRRFLRNPRRALRSRRGRRDALAGALTVPAIHAPEVLRHVRELDPDLGVIYGSPILKPELFEIPRLGTLGIHQGKLPGYRGKKTTFWAMYNGEATAGVAIQKVNSGLDTGEIVLSGEVAIRGRRYGRVDAEVQRLGIDLYVEAILAVRNGTATFQAQPPGESVLYRQPRIGDIVRLWRRQLTRGGST